MSELAVGKVIKMACMRAGLVKYSNETILVGKAALEQLAPTMMGVPVVLDHPNDKITDANIGSLPVVGRVADMHWDEEEGVWLAHFVVDDEAAVKLLESGYGVSTAWYGLKYGAGGTYNNIVFDRELLEGKYEHLAIVSQPRYEMAVDPIFMNSKDGQNDRVNNIIKTDNSKRSVSMIGKVFRKLISREEIMVNSGEQVVVEVDGKDVPLADVIADAAKKNSIFDRKVNGEDTFEVDGESLTINALVEAYRNAKKKNEDESKEEEDAEEKKLKEKKENEDKEAADKDKKEEEAKTNARHLDLETAHMNGIVEDPNTMLTIADRTALGRKLYGSK
jgi:hypothetical protein